MECGWPVAGTALSGRSMADRCAYLATVAQDTVPMECGWSVAGSALSGRSMADRCGIVGDGGLGYGPYGVWLSCGRNYSEWP